ncbi:MAG: YkgJ family cysteine cluster protein [Pseudobdellovibrionaceae bacterium]
MSQTKSATGKKWWSEGLRFQCQGSGQCCTSHGEYGFVFLTKDDRKRMATHLQLSLSEFTKKHCQRTNGFFHLKEDGKNPDCLFLKNKRCSVYEARPIQCRTWPFWPDVMNAKTWKKEVVSFCPGVGKGPMIKSEKIQEILNEQIASEDDLDQEAKAFLLKSKL